MRIIKLKNIKSFVALVLVCMVGPLIISCSGQNNNVNGNGSGSPDFKKGILQFPTNSITTYQGSSNLITVEIVGSVGLIGQRVNLSVSDPTKAALSSSYCIIESSQSPSCSVSISGKALGTFTVNATSENYTPASVSGATLSNNGIGQLSVVGYSNGSQFGYYQGSSNVQLSLVMKFTPQSGAASVPATTPITVLVTNTGGPAISWTVSQCQLYDTQNYCTLTGTFDATTVGSAPWTINAQVTGKWQDGSISNSPWNGHPVFTSIVMTPTSLQSPGQIVVSSQSNSKVVYSGTTAPLFVNLNNNYLTNATYDVTLSIPTTYQNYLNFYDRNGSAFNKTCKLIVSATGQAPQLNCGYNLQIASGIPSATRVPVNVSVTSPTSSTLPSFDTEIHLDIVPMSQAEGTRAITLTNFSSKSIVFGATTGSSGAFNSPVDASATSNCDSDSAGPSGSPTQACPIGAVCAKPGSAYTCYWNIPTASNPVVPPNASAQLLIPGYSGGTTSQQWSGTFWALPCLDSSTSNCPPIPTQVGTAPQNSAQTIAEITFLRDNNDSYDVSLVNGATNGIAFGPDPSSGLSSGANLFGNTSPYNCGTAGSKQTQGPLPASNWIFAPTSANFPVSVSDSAASYFAVVTPSTTTQPCSVQSTCSSRTDGNTVCGLNSTTVTSSSQNPRVCGSFQYWATADQISSWAGGGFSDIKNAFNFNGTSPGSNPSVTTSTLQSCAAGTGTYSAYNAPSGVAANVCGGSYTLSSPWVNVNPSYGAPVDNTFWDANIGPTVKWIKQACPTCYSFEYDDPSSSFVCSQFQSGPNVLNYIMTVYDLTNTFN